MYKFIDEDNKHIHTWESKPLMGTTTLVKEVMPPPLAWYGSGKALEPMGWTNPKFIPREAGLKSVQEWLKNGIPHTSEQWYDFLQECYRNHDEFKKEAGDWGTETHEKIETAIKEAIKNNAGFLSEHYEDEVVERFATWGRGKEFLYSEVHCYSTLLWLGGVIDFIYREDGKYYLGDTKTSKAIYPSQFIQAGLYDCQQGENGFYDKDGVKLGDPLKIEGYTIVNIPKKGGIKHSTYRGTKQLRELGVNLVQTYKILQELKQII